MIGVSCTAFSSEDFCRTWDRVSEHFSHWEIFSEVEHAVENNLSRFIKSRDSYDMTYSIHSPICDTNVAALNENMRRATVDEMIMVMDCSRKMDIKTITIHPGIYSLAVYDVREKSVKAAQRSMKELEKAQNEHGVVLAIENMPSFEIMMGQTAKELETIIEGTDLKVCFDIGHAHTMGQIDAMLDTFRGRIANVHIHDNMGDKDSHMTIGKGNIDFKHVLSGLSSYKGNYIIESKTLESAIESKAVLEKMLSH